MAAFILGGRKDVIEKIRYVTRDDLFGLNTTMIIPLNAYILKMINKSDSVDANYSSVNPINLLLTLNKTKPGMIHFNRFSEAPAPVWFQFHSAIILLAYFIIICLVLYVLLIATVIFGRIWRYSYSLSRITKGMKTKTNLHTIVENIQEIRRLQVARIETESEQKLFNQIWNELHDKYQPSRGKKVETFFPNDFNNRNV